MRRLSLVLIVLVACALVGWLAGSVEAAAAREFISGSVLVDPLESIREPGILALFGVGLIYGAARLRRMRRSTR